MLSSLKFFENLIASQVQISGVNGKTNFEKGNVLSQLSIVFWTRIVSWATWPDER